MTKDDIQDILSVVDSFSNLDNCYDEVFSALCDMFVDEMED